MRTACYLLLLGVAACVALPTLTMDEPSQTSALAEQHLFAMPEAKPTHMIMQLGDSSPSISTISATRRAELLANPDHKTPAELNKEVLPLINGAEVVSRSTAEGGSRVRVYVWNMERGKGWSNAAQWWQGDDRANGAHVVLLNEMDWGMARSGNVQTTDKFAAALGMNSAFGVEFLELTKGLPEEQAAAEGVDDQKGFHGNSIVSKLPLENSFVLRFDNPIDQWYNGDLAPEHSERRLGGRMALFSKVKAGPASVWMISAHLECKTGSDTSHVVEADQICDKLSALNANKAVIGGDLCDDASFFDRLASKCGFLARSATNQVDKFTYPSREHCYSDGNADGLYVRGDWVAVKGMTVVPGSMRTIAPHASGDKCLADHLAIAIDLDA